MSAKQTDNTPAKQAIKAASGALVKAVGGVEAAEQSCRAGFRRLSEYGRPENDCFMPVDVVADLEEIAHGTPGYPQVTRLLARRAGFTLVKLPTSGVSTGNLHAALAAAIKESNDVATRLLTALGDGVVSPEEARANKAECVEAAEQYMMLHALLEQLAGEP